MITLEALEKIASIVMSGATITGIVYGIITARNYKLKIKDKQNEAVFSFYARLKVYLLDFQKRLGKNHGNNILQYKYKNESIKIFENFSKPKQDEVKSFIDFILFFIDFLKNAENQVFLCETFENNFNEFKKKLFDLTELMGSVQYAEYNDNKPAADEYNFISTLVNNLLTDIENEQYKILGKKVSRNIFFLKKKDNK